MRQNRNQTASVSNRAPSINNTVNWEDSDAQSKFIQTRLQQNQQEPIKMSIKKIQILQNKLDILYKLKKNHEPTTIAKAHDLFQISLSFAIIMLIHKNADLYQQHLSLSLKTLMRLMNQQRAQFDFDSKQHVPLFILLSFTYLCHKRYKLALKFIYHAQKIVMKLDVSQPRNLDHIIAVNIIASLIMIHIGNPGQALQFLTTAEQMIHTLISRSVVEPLGLYQENGSEGGKDTMRIGTEDEAANQSQDLQQQTFTFDGNAKKQSATDRNMDQDLRVAENPGSSKRKNKVEFVFDNLEQDGAPSNKESRNDSKLEKTPTFAGPKNQSRIPHNAKPRGQSRGGSKEAGRPRSRLTSSICDQSNSFIQPDESQSKMSITLLQNYLLALHLMKNIANRYTLDNSDTFDIVVATDLKKVRDFDFCMKKAQAPPMPQPSPKIVDGKSIDPNADLDLEDEQFVDNSETGIAFLLVQHKHEILDQNLDYLHVLNETFSQEFMSMIQMCLFVPFLHDETPKPAKVPKTQLHVHDHKSFLPVQSEIRDFIVLRNKLLNTQDSLQQEIMMQNQLAHERSQSFHDAFQSFDSRPASKQLEPTVKAVKSLMPHQRPGKTPSPNKNRVKINMQMNKILGVPTFDKMTSALIKSKKVVDSLDENQDMYSWSREDASNQYLDKTMSRKSSTAIVGQDEELINDETKGHQNPQPQHNRSAINYQSNEVIEEVQQKDKALRSQRDKRKSEHSNVDVSTESAKIAFKAAQEKVLSQNGPQVVDPVNIFNSSKMDTSFEATFEKQQEPSRSIPSNPFSKEELPNDKIEPAITQPSDLPVFAIGNSGETHMSSTAALMNEKIDNMKIQSNEFGLKQAKSKDLRGNESGQEQSYIRIRGETRAGSRVKTRKASMDASGRSKQQHVQKVQEAKDIQQIMQLKKQMDMSSTSPPSGQQAPVKPFNAIQVEGVEPGGSPKLQQQRIKQKTVQNTSDNNIHKQPSQGINDCAALTEVSYASNQHNRSLSDYKKKFGFEKPQYKTINHEEVIEKASKQTKKGFISLQAPSTQNQQQQLPHHLIPVSNDNYNEIKGKIQNHYQTIQKQEILQRKLQGSSLCYAARQKKKIRGVSEFIGNRKSSHVVSMAPPGEQIFAEGPQVSTSIKLQGNNYSVSHQMKVDMFQGVNSSYEASNNNLQSNNKTKLMELRKNGSKTVLEQQNNKNNMGEQPLITIMSNNVLTANSKEIRQRRFNQSQMFNNQELVQDRSINSQERNIFSQNQLFYQYQQKFVQQNPKQQRRNIKVCDNQQNDNQMTNFEIEQQSRANMDLNTIQNHSDNEQQQNFQYGSQAIPNRSLASQLQKTIEIYKQHRPSTKGSTSFHQRKNTFQPQAFNDLNLQQRSIQNNRFFSNAQNSNTFHTLGMNQVASFPAGQSEKNSTVHLSNQAPTPQNVHSEQQYAMIPSTQYNSRVAELAISSAENSHTALDRQALNTSQDNNIFYQSRNKNKETSKSDGYQGSVGGPATGKSQTSNYQKSVNANIVGSKQPGKMENLNEVSVVDPTSTFQKKKSSGKNQFGKQYGFHNPASIYQNMGNLVDINYYKNKLNALEKKQDRNWKSSGFNRINYNSDIAPLTEKSHGQSHQSHNSLTKKNDNNE